MNNAVDSSTGRRTRERKKKNPKQSKRLSWIWIGAKLTETEKAGWLPVGIIVETAEISMKLACFQEDP